MEKGKTNNPNGRPKGAVNKTTKKTKELIAKFVDENFTTIMEDLKVLEPKDRVAAFINLLKYVVPPARDQEAQDETTDAISNLVKRLFPLQNE